MPNLLNATELDFDKIRTNLKEYLEAQTQFNDYNFDGSGMAILLDLLAYNTHYNALNAHYTINESFLDSAQIRGNVISHAKLLGYTPRSTLGSTVSVDMDIIDPIEVNLAVPATLTLLRGTSLTSVINGVTFPFVVLDSKTINQNNDEFGIPNGTFTFKDISIKQGILKTIRDKVDTTVDNQRFVIPDQNIDTTTMVVRVRDNIDSENYLIYNKFTSFINLDAVSNVFFLQENTGGSYEIYFGDGITGLKPSSNNIVEIEYIYSSGEDGNGAGKNSDKPFILASEIDGNTEDKVDISISILGELSTGGSFREGLESIRYNAPLTFITQNRAVTADDYKSIIIKEYGDIETLSTWGGENSDPPDFGRVYVSIKPKSGRVLTASAKTEITTILRGKNVVSIEPVFVDPEYTYIALDVFFKYNPNQTDRTNAELEALCLQVITDYNLTSLRRFNGVMRHSNLLSTIDSADAGIISSNARVYMLKKININAKVVNSHILNFSSPTYITKGSSYTISSTTFKINGVDCFFGDEIDLDNPTQRIVFVYKTIDDIDIKVIPKAGTIYPDLGKVVLENFTPDSSIEVRVTMTPNSYDIAPKRNQLLDMELSEVNITGSIDRIEVAGSAGAVDYVTSSRHR